MLIFRPPQFPRMPVGPAAFTRARIHPEYCWSHRPRVILGSIMLRNAVIFVAWAAVVATSATGQQSLSGSKAGEIRANSKDDEEYAWIPAGAFNMGCSPGDTECRGEQAWHVVTIAHGFWIGRTEVTVGAYKRFVAATRAIMPPESDWNPGWQDGKRPIVNLTWDEAAAFCSAAGGRLPSEEEWEYAARAGNEAARYGVLNDIAWYADNSGHKGPVPVKQKLPNGWGLYDMLGNVWEWTTGLYPLTGKNDGPNLPTNPSSPFWAIRGGSWADETRLLRVSVRGRAETSHRSNSIGARCALDGL
jgi:formylglycine-generating enzyme required for sulfatase activity